MAGIRRCGIGVNPARAGMILTARDGWMIWEGKPRASGDDPGLLLSMHKPIE